MKRFMGTLVMGSMLFLGTGAFAAEPQSGEGMNGATIESSAPDAGLKLQANGDSNAQCWAHTTCADGRRISCWSTGDACRWSYVAGVSVSCYGQSYGGAYAYHNEYCY